MNKNIIIKKFLIINLKYVFGVLGLIIGTIFYFIDIHTPAKLDGIAWLINNSVLAVIGFSLGIYIKRLYVDVYTDKSTGLLNKAYFYRKLQNEISKVEINNTYLTLMLVDIDDFKYINDKYGNIQGDLVLKKIADILKENIRKGDVAVRWGGDELAVILPNCNEEIALKIVDRITESITSWKFNFENGDYHVSASIGTYTSNVKLRADEFTEFADNALYEAKKNKKIKI